MKPQNSNAETLLDGVIIGAVIQSKQGAAPSLAACVKEIEGVELYAIDEQERLVITVEAKNTGEAVEKVQCLEQMEGVLYVNAVQHYCESDSIENGGWTWR